MMQIFLQRTIWLFVWAAVMVLMLWLCWDMRSEQPILFATIVLCAFVVSVALVYARSHWTGGNKTSAVAALVMGTLSLGVIIVSDIAYWSGAIDGMHEHIQRERSLTSGQDLVKDRRRKQLSQAAAGKLPSEIEAELVTAKNTEIASLRAQLKAARDLERLQGQVFADSTETVSYSAKRSLYHAAIWGSENFGGDVRTWLGWIVALIVGCMLSLHLLSLYVGFAPVKPRTASKSSEAPSIPQEAASPFLEALRAPDPTPPPPPEKAPVPVETKPEKFVPRIVEPVAPPVKPRSKAERLEAVDAITRRWILERNVVKASFGEGLPAATVYLDYRNFAGRSAVSNSHFGRSIKRCGFDTKSTATGARYKLAINGKKEAVA